jgi:hypothetical protein
MYSSVKSCVAALIEACSGKLSPRRLTAQVLRARSSSFQI